MLNVGFCIGLSSACLMLLDGAVADAKVLYRSDGPTWAGDPADLKEWRLEGANYQVQAGWLHVSSEKSNPCATLRIGHDGDGTFRATVRNARTCHWTALQGKGVFRLEVNNEFTRLALHRLTDKQWKLVGEAKDYGNYARNRYEFELRLVFVGTKVYGFLDDKKLIEYEGPAPVPPGGQYGLVSGWGTDLSWRSVSLTDEPDLSQWPMETPPKAAPKDLVTVTWVRGLTDDNIYADREMAGLKFRVLTGRKSETKVRLVYRLIDVRQQAVGEQTEAATLRPGQEAQLAVQFIPPCRGCFKVALYAGTGESEPAWVEDLGSFTVLPRSVNDAPRNPDSYFGGHMDGIHLEWHLRTGRKLGIQWARGHDMLQHTWWTRIQPDRPDQWNWMDDTQKSLDQMGFSTLGEFLWTPRWAGAKVGDSRPQALPEEAAFARYVANTVSHYGKSIHYWEVWNEPFFSGFWGGTAEEYAKLLQIAYREAKKADPGCFVLGGGGVDLGNMGWIEKMVRSLPGKSMDGCSIHYLEPEMAAEQLGRLRALLKERGMEVPIWNTEASVPTSSFLDQNRLAAMEPEARYHFRNACYELVRMYMENIANGVQRVFHYEQADPWRFQEFAKPRVFPHSPLGVGMWDEGRMLKPIAAAHAAMALVIEGKTYKSRTSVGELRAFFFQGKDTAAAVQYAAFKKFDTCTTVRLGLPEGANNGDFAVVNFMGNESAPVTDRGHIILPLSREPVYLICRGPNGADVLQRMYACTLGPVASAQTTQPDKAMMGMKIELVQSKDGTTTFVTTGARFVLGADTLVCWQRIGEERKVLELKFVAGGAFEVKPSSDFACTANSPKLRLTFQGDSVVVVQPQGEAAIRYRGLFEPEYQATKDGHRLVLDQAGGFGLYPTVAKKSTSPAEVREAGWDGEYGLAKGEELWLGVFPPRLANPKRLAESVAHEGRADQPYPPNEIIRSDAKYCRVLAVHAYFWKDVPEALKPKTGTYAGRPNPWLTDRHVPSDMKEFVRMRDEAHRLGMKFVVYLSPYYSTAPDIAAEMKRVIDEYKVDGLYFDGVSNDFRKSYRIVRQARQLLGDDGILYIHCSTDPLGSARVYCPFVDTYADYILRGEAGRADLPLARFLRWTISGRNISNAVGYWCYYGSTGKPGYVNQLPTAQDIQSVLAAGARLWRTAQFWSQSGADIGTFDEAYYGRLKAAATEPSTRP